LIVLPPNVIVTCDRDPADWLFKFTRDHLVSANVFGDDAHPPRINATNSAKAIRLSRGRMFLSGTI